MKRFMAFPKQNTSILISFVLHSVLTKETSEKVIEPTSLTFTTLRMFYPETVALLNQKRFAEKNSKLSETVRGAPILP